MAHLLDNPETWVLVAFVIFIGLVSKKAYTVITLALDSRATRINEELEQATRLREEAQALLAQYERQQRGLSNETEAMLVQARRDSEILVESGTALLEEQLRRREKQALQSIAHSEAQLASDVRALAAEVTMAAAAQLILENLDNAQAETLINDSISSLRNRLGDHSLVSQSNH